ncbi:MAG: thioredoxin domain-containing protein, partial [Bdellovibrionaceae bacterium]|nr:thioredoxin domain-containing protein [Pseudobdellovibrionaceae bacterium]
MTFSKSVLNKKWPPVLLSCLMLGLSIYLTVHYFEVIYPKGLQSSSFCNLNDFFNCDASIQSVFSSILGVPISAFGIILSFFTLIGVSFGTESFRNTVTVNLLLNLIGCALLFFCSLVFVGSICPLCFLYYVASALTFYICRKQNPHFLKKPAQSLRINVLYGVLIAVVLSAVHAYDNQLKSQTEQSDRLLVEATMSEYTAQPLVDFKEESKFKLATQADAPIRLVIFSDFECPACKMFSEQLHELIPKYQGKIDISYHFYPLDQSCNSSIKRVMHQHACEAARVVLCLPPAEFQATHDDLFKNQNQLENRLKQITSERNLQSCVQHAATEKALQADLAAAGKVELQSTPTFLLNGRKLEGVI